MRRLASIVMATTCLFAMGMSAAPAQTLRDSARPAATRPSTPDNPNEGVQPNGCVKLCPLDTNPCDPPSYKRADGRCTLR